MPSITTWTRLEPRPRDPSLRESVQAQVRDPLWLLARQWQLAEFEGENAGSPVQISVSYQTTIIDGYTPRPELGKSVQPYRRDEHPLEALVEAEAAVAGGPDGRRRVEAGLEFLRRLSQALREKYEPRFTDATYGLALDTPGGALDPGSQAFYSLMAGRVPDGAKLRARLPQDLNLALDWRRAPPVTGVDRGDQSALEGVLKDWAAWYDTQVPSAPESAWDPARLEYRFGVSAPATDAAGAATPLTLTASEYPGGQLDWHAFDVEAGATAKRLGRSNTISTRPVGIQFPGMPASRFWSFESGSVDFGNLETARTDLARLLFAEFALVYGNDFFLIPIELEIGSLARIESLNVTDSFGQTRSIKAASQVDREANGHNGRAPWRMFTLSSQQASAEAEDLLFLVPALAGGAHGRPVEEVTFLRDEMANCVWAIENRVMGQNSRPYARAEAYQAEQQKRPEAEKEIGPLAYRLFTRVPDYWHPLLPRRTTPSGPLCLELRDSGEIAGVLLAGDTGSPLLLYEEEVPRSGLTVRREPQLARWMDGRVFAWIGRNKRPGPGEGSSGLQFDVLEPTKEDG